jgi:ubiquinone/menaquinone biosynthesis C-methylase UbiE
MKNMNAVDWHSSIAQDFDSEYSKTEQFQERYFVWKTAIDKYSNQNSHVIDIGCGSGIFSLYASQLNKSVTGLDGSQKMIDLCHQKSSALNTSNIQFLVSSFSDMPATADIKSDITMCSSILEYIPDFENSLSTVKSMTKEGGFVFISMPNKSSLYRKMESVIFRLSGKPKYYAFVLHTTTVQQMEQLLVKHGMTPIEHTYYAKVRILSSLLGLFGLQKYSDSLFLIVARRDSQRNAG